MVSISHSTPMSTYRITDIIDSNVAISPKKGLRVFDFVQQELQKGNNVTISFEGVTNCTSAFCNSFIGKLFMTQSVEILNSNLSIDTVGNARWQSKVESATTLGSNKRVQDSLKDSYSSLSV